MASAGRQIRRQNKQKNAQPQKEENFEHGDQLDLFAPQVEGVSVIVCARNEEENLRHYLQALLEQDYPLYEVIVVNDGSEDNTQAIIKEYGRRYHHMRTTFVPLEARIQSSKKLAITLAAKAARYKYLLLTDADCVPESKNWISEMKNQLEQEGTEVVLGYGAYFVEHDRVNDVIQYDTLFNGLQYLGMANNRHPYMGVGRNLGYRKEMFFDHNGFAGILSERSGDDDLFVNRVANRRNTRVCISRDSLTWSVPKHTYKEWIQQKRRHLSVAPLYSASSRLRLGLEPMVRGLFYASVIVGLCIGSALTAGAVLLALVLRLIMQMVVLNGAARKLGGRTFGLDVMWYDMTLPLLTLWLMATNRDNPQRW